MVIDKKALISIIVPVYGVEQYLPECIDSLIQQTYSNFEIILVDDGSPDRCGEICDTYAKKDNRIVVLHKENGGVSAARQDGFSLSTGSWITFVDADDTLPTTALECLYNNSGKSDCIVGLFDNQCIPPHTHIPTRSLVQSIITNDCNSTDLFKRYLKFEKSYRWELCGKLFKRSLLTKEMLFVDRKIKVFEDYIIALRYLSKIDSVTYVPEVVYNYRQREESSTSEFKYSLDLVKSLSPLIIEATHKMPGEYSAELRINQLSLLSSVIGDKQLTKDDVWYLQVKKRVENSSISQEAKLSLWLVEYCQVACLRRCILSFYQQLRKIKNK